MAKKLAMFFGIVFVLVGLLGFVPNPIVGPNGYFVTNTAHDFLHILVGAILLSLGYVSEHAAKLALYGTGAAYLLLAVLGFVQMGGSSEVMLLDAVHVNHNDNWLHVVLGVVLIVSGLAAKEQHGHVLRSTH